MLKTEEKLAPPPPWGGRTRGAAFQRNGEEASQQRGGRDSSQWETETPRDQRETRQKPGKGDPGMGEGAQRDLGREKRHPGRAQRDPGREHRDLAKSTESREKEHRDPGSENRETPRESQPAERLRDYWGGGGGGVGIRLGGRDTGRQRYRDVEGHREAPTHGGKRRKKLRQDRGPAMRTAAHTRTGRDAGRRLSELSGAGPSGHVLTGQIAPGPSGRGTRVGAGTARPGPSLPSPRRRPRGVGDSKLTPRAPRDRTCARAASETGARRLRIPCRLGGGACEAGARPGPARSWGG